MKKFIIFATKHNGEIIRICPSVCCQDENEMLKIAKRLKYDMIDYFKKVELRCDLYFYKESNFIEF